MTRALARVTAKQATFLAAYRECGRIDRSCKVADIQPSEVHQWLEHDETFADGLIRAKQHAAMVLEDEATRRAVDGVDRPVFYQGMMCGVVREYSDALLMFLLRALKPETYRERSEVRHGLAHEDWLRKLDEVDVLDVTDQAEGDGVDGDK